MARNNKNKHHRTHEFDKPEYFADRELTWLAFNERVIEEAEDQQVPLLERVRFLGIASSNLDEFFMVRVSGIQEQLQADVRTRNSAGFTPEEQFERVHRRVHEQVARMYEALNRTLLPALATEGIYLRRSSELTRQQKAFLREYFDREVFPVLTPLAVDSGHPFPHLRNLSLNLAVRLDPHEDKPTSLLFAVVQVPTVLDRLVRLPAKDGHFEYILLEELISQEISLLFPGMKVREVSAFRVTRDGDIEFAEEEADDLLKTIEEELRLRERGSAVRLSVEKKSSAELVALLQKTIGLTPMQVYALDGPINLSEVSGLANQVDRSDLKYQPFVPSIRRPMRTHKNIFRAIASGDILLHHPYESFSTVSDFIEQAANDPNVLAIKQTLYRTSGDSNIVKSLMLAAENGKQVAALMELKARFDEERNIGWARQMEKAGVHVVYGLVGLKTHAKLCLVVRKEDGGLRRYVHLGTGNYNPITARVYTDLGLLSCDPDLCDDASELFNLLTGYSRMPEWRKIVVAPSHMRDFFLQSIEREIEKAQAGGKGRIRAKLNSLVDDEIIMALYRASCAGVSIDLLVRGICCLRPGIKGVSENIRVSSIVDRFLEHSRLYIFGEGDDETVWLSSADWMQRNLDRRVETAFPIENPALKRRIIDEIWTIAMMDNVKRRHLQSDGVYIRPKAREGEPLVRSQVEFLRVEEGLRQEVTVKPVEILVSQAPPGAATEEALPQQRPAMPAARILKTTRPAKTLGAGGTDGTTA